MAPPKYLQIAAPLCQRTESGKAAGQRKHGNDRAGQTQNSASHASQTQNGQHNGEYLCSCDGGCDKKNADILADVFLKKA